MSGAVTVCDTCGLQTLNPALIGRTCNAGMAGGGYCSGTVQPIAWLNSQPAVYESTPVELDGGEVSGHGGGDALEVSAE